MSSDLRARVAAYCAQEKLFHKRDRVIVGVSGGPDSICLLHVLCSFRAEWKISLTAVHVNHGLRETAGEDAEYVKQMCGEWDIPYKEYCCDVREVAAEKKMSLEEAGRYARYEAFADAKEAYGANKVALAHHMDDQVETILWNLFRGTGSKGLSGMAARRDDIVRPLLCVSKEEILEYLREKDIAYRVDETNGENTFTRNKLRNQLIPTIENEYNRQSRQHIVGAGAVIARMEDYISKQAEAAVKKCVKRLSKNSVLIRGKAYRKQEPILREAVLRQALYDMAGTQKDIGQVHIHILEELMENQVGREADLPYGLQAFKTYDGICIRAREKRSAEKVGNLGDSDLSGHFTFRSIELKHANSWKKYIKEKRYTKCFDYDIIKSGLKARTREPGDYIVIDSAGNTQKLKYYFINEKVPREIRDTVPLLAEGQLIHWVVGYRVSEIGKVTEDTKRVLEVTYRR